MPVMIDVIQVWDTKQQANRSWMASFIHITVSYFFVYVFTYRVILFYFVLIVDNRVQIVHDLCCYDA